MVCMIRCNNSKMCSFFCFCKEKSVYWKMLELVDLYKCLHQDRIEGDDLSAMSVWFVYFIFYFFLFVCLFWLTQLSLCKIKIESSCELSTMNRCFGAVRCAVIALWASQFLLFVIICICFFFLVKPICVHSDCTLTVTSKESSCSSSSSSCSCSCSCTCSSSCSSCTVDWFPTHSSFCSSSSSCSCCSIIDDCWRYRRLLWRREPGYAEVPSSIC